MVGDFNVDIGFHYKFDKYPRNKTSIYEFLNWTNKNGLCILKLMVHYYNWTNGRKCGGNAFVRLEWIICNHNWLDNKKNN